jgi:hypothetical protein
MFTIKDLMKQQGITYFSSCTKVRDYPKREIVARALGIYSGLIIVRELNRKESYFAIKYVIGYEYSGHINAQCFRLDLIKAINKLKEWRDKGYPVELSKEVEDKLYSSIFMKNI